MFFHSFYRNSYTTKPRFNQITIAMLIKIESIFFKVDSFFLTGIRQPKKPKLLFFGFYNLAYL